MATLQFNKLQPIGFGDKELTPVANTEMKLRLQQAKGDTEEDLKNLIELISKCFGDDAKFVKDFIDKYMTLVDIYRLQAYIAGGEKMLEVINNNFDKAFEKEMENLDEK